MRRKMNDEACTRCSVRMKGYVAMNSGYVTINDLTKRLDWINVAFRMVLVAHDEGWYLHTLVIEEIPTKPNEQLPRYHYNYSNCIFIAGALNGEKVFNFLKGSELNGSTFHSPLAPQINSNNLAAISWIKYPSHTSQTGFAPIPYPVTQYRIGYVSVPVSTPNDFLVGRDCPFFPSFQQAVQSLIYGITDPYQSHNTQEAFIVRVVHDLAHIEQVNISPTQLTIELGDAVNTSMLQVASPPDVFYDKVVSSQDPVAIPLPDGIPSELWILLKRGNDWLDYVHLGQQSPFHRNQQNVSVAPPDISIRIQELIALGEGPTTEFKQEIPDKADKMLKTVAAFANGNGGVILLGVEDETGKVIGIPRDNVNREKDRITNMIRNIVYPDPVVRLEQVDMNEKDAQGQVIIAIYVDRGTLPPYCLHAQKPDYYVRRGATTFIARQEEVRAIVQLGTQLSNIQRNGL